MKIRAMALLAVIELSAQANDFQDRQLAPVTVYVRYTFGDFGLVPACAEDIASQMFARAGVQIRWRSGQPNSSEGEQAINVEVTSNTPQAFKPGAWAYARVYEGVHIRIFWDRLVQAGRSRANQLLAHVMVHEITHILEGVDRHSESGVMKAHWTADDILQMHMEPLPFDPHDVKLIHDGLARIGQNPNADNSAGHRSGSEPQP